ncbi:hypothetical protein MJO28_005748 [Puccinia striiformis f. sp. tritici]|uniref:Uncharacterized protein n=1 Tax=Puccinia striiformis f. sp. tritici TaxID=168172 RepID=A0ACC0ENH2_9BASI|nr:hypothetical protein MJO28_005748 [Puccinia striiformis f. sp. tritici]
MVDYDFIDQIYRFSAHLRFEGANNHQNPSRNENDIITFQRMIALSEDLAAARDSIVAGDSPNSGEITDSRPEIEIVFCKILDDFVEDEEADQDC